MDTDRETIVSNLDKILMNLTHQKEKCMDLSQRIKEAPENNAETFNAWLNKNREEVDGEEKEEEEDDSDFER